MQQRRPQRRRPLPRIAGRRRAEPVREPHRPRSARDGAAQEPECEQHAADHAVAARDQAWTQAHHAFGRLDGAGQVTASAAGRQLGRAVLARQARRLLGGRAEPGQNAVAMIEPSPGQRPEHRGRVPPADDPDVKPAGHDPVPARPALLGMGGRRGVPGAGDDRIRQPDRVRRRNGDHARLGNGIGKFQVEGLRQGRQDLARPARAAQQVTDRQAGHPGGRRRRRIGRRLRARWSSHEDHSNCPPKYRPP